MSRWFPEPSRVLVSQTRVALAREGTPPVRTAITIARGDGSENEDTAAAADAGLRSRELASALRQVLESSAGAGGPTLDVYLESDLVRFLVVPWHADFITPATRRAYATHRFVSTFGTVARQWMIVEAAGRFGEASLVAAIDRSLADELDGAARACGRRVRRLVPALIPAYNANRRAIDGDTFWFVLFESQRMTVLLMRAGAPQLIRSLPRSEAQLGEHLDREWRLLGLPDETCPVYCLDHRIPGQASREFGRWRARSGSLADVLRDLWLSDARVQESGLVPGTLMRTP